METLVELVSPAGGGGGSVSRIGLESAALFRGFDGDSSGGGAVSKVVEGGEAIDDDGGGGSSIGLGGDEFVEAVIRGRLAGGGVLEQKGKTLIYIV